MKHRFTSIVLSALLFLAACSPYTDTEQLETDTAAADPAIPQEVWAGSDVYEVIPLVPDAGPHAGEPLIYNEYIPAGFFTTQEVILFVDWDQDAYACFIESFDREGDHHGRNFRMAFR